MTEKTVTKSVRLDREVAEFYEDKPLRSVLESLYGLCDSGGAEISGGEVTIKGTGGDMKELEDMAKCWGVDTEALIADFVVLLQDGLIKMRGGMLWVDETPGNWDDFAGWCRDNGVKPEKALERVMKSGYI